MTQKSLLERNYWSVTWPIIIDLCLGMGLMFTDFVFLSQVSDNVAAAVGAVLPIIHITGTLYFPLGQGCAALLGNRLGAKSYTDVGFIHGISIWLAITLGLIMFASMLLLYDNMGIILGLPDELAEHASQYLLIVSVSFIFISVQKVLASLMRCYGETRWIMYNAIILNSINIVLNSLFLFNVIPTGLTGVQNVALATVIASFCGMLWCLWGVLMRLPHKTMWCPNYPLAKSIVRKIMKVATPGTIEPLNYQISQAAMVALIVPLGAIAIATRAYVSTSLILVMVFELGIAISTSIYISHHIGARDFESANARLKKNLMQAVAISVALNCALYLGGGAFLSLFTDQQAIVDLGKKILLIGMFWGPAKAVNLVIGNSLRASGDAMFSSYIGISLWVVGLPLAYLFGIKMEYGLVGIWLAYAVDENVRALLHFVRWENRINKSDSLGIA